MSSHEHSLTDKQRFWLEHVKACNESDQSMREYAEARELDLAAFYSAKSVLRQKGIIEGKASDKQPLFTKARLSEGRSLGRCRLVLPTGAVLELDAGTDPAWVAQLVRSLGAV
jgi:hypothetical protein